MGMYDTLCFPCPNCGYTNGYQSKLGENTLTNYSLSTAPLLLIADANDEGLRDRLYCVACNAKLRIAVQFKAEVVAVGDKESTSPFRSV